MSVYSRLHVEYQNADPIHSRPGIPKRYLSKLCQNLTLFLKVSSVKLCLTLYLFRNLSSKQIQEPLVREKNGGEEFWGESSGAVNKPCYLFPLPSGHLKK